MQYEIHAGFHTASNKHARPGMRLEGREMKSGWKEKKRGEGMKEKESRKGSKEGREERECTLPC